MARCKFCGQEIADNAVVCDWCGMRRDAEPEKTSSGELAFRVRTGRDIPMAEKTFLVGKTGRTFSAAFISVWLLVIVACGFIVPWLTHTPPPKYDAESILIVGSMTLVGVFFLIAELMWRDKGLVAFFPEGFIHRNWCGKVRFVPWVEIREVRIFDWPSNYRYYRRRSQPAYSVFLRTETTGAKVNLTVDNDKDRATQLASQLAGRAQLELDESESQGLYQVWDRPAARKDESPREGEQNKS